MPNKKYNWPELIEAFNGSGLTQTEFCKQRDINPKYFNQKLSKSKISVARPFVKAKVSPPTSVPTSIVVDVGACRVHIPTILPPQYLADLLKALS